MNLTVALEHERIAKIMILQLNIVLFLIHKLVLDTSYKYGIHPSTSLQIQIKMTQQGA